ncbi:hypothetical protein TUM4438_43830 [Shewanella sairae]|uniref:Uncharacterized protein n=1 Tax=Shewanella sairae TaxID=190310 RepID=A0ABQ4PRA3_9GAMM|nr:hypothetical protein [Shewanella sairae]MCL1132468.1 hypothetical protein [Shewanella sairae]GIU52074.1 hypothetical protein TUM4438_43830 [Shewanella sairae]
MLKPRKQCKHVPITLEAGLLKVLKGRVLLFDCIGENSVDMYYTDAGELINQYHPKFLVFEALLQRLVDKGVLEYGCSSWVITGDKAGRKQELSLPRAIGQSRLKRANKGHRLCTEDERRSSIGWMAGLEAFYCGVSTTDNPYEQNSIEYQGWLEGWQGSYELDDEMRAWHEGGKAFNNG